MEILILDDDGTSAAMHRHFVKRFTNCTAVCFANPLEALEWCCTHDPVIAIVDYWMPQMDGIEFTQRLRLLPGKAATPVLMATSCDDSALRARARAVGIAEFLAKPVGRIELTACILNALSMRPQAAPESAAASKPDDAALRRILEARERVRAAGGTESCAR